MFLDQKNIRRVILPTNLYFITEIAFLNIFAINRNGLTVWSFEFATAVFLMIYTCERNKEVLQ